MLNGCLIPAYRRFVFRQSTLVTTDDSSLARDLNMASRPHHGRFISRDRVYCIGIQTPSLSLVDPALLNLSCHFVALYLEHRADRRREYAAAPR